MLWLDYEWCHSLAGEMCNNVTCSQFGREEHAHEEELLVFAGDLRMTCTPARRATHGPCYPGE